MIVVSDTTPLRYLIELETVHLLESLFGQVIIPQAVATELQGANTPQKVKDWIQACLDWLEVRAVDASNYHPVIEIHAGEREAIALALELAADGILVDDKDARTEAQRAGLTVIPTLAILELAARRDLIDLPAVMAQLRKTSFHISQKLYDEVIERDQLRRQKPQGTP
jgi:predicted nucleic acid-binding protein